MKIIEQLNKLPIISGEYLVLPSIERPFFIIPMTSNLAFKKAIRFIKPKNNYGWVKKIVLRALPFVLIRFIFHTIRVSTKFTAESTQLILPWNQDFENKFVIFNLSDEPSIIKIGFNYASKLIQNEHKVIATYFNNNEIFPKIINYQLNEDYSILETAFYKGNHPNVLPQSIIDFFILKYNNCKSVDFNDHPYINEMMKLIFEKLDTNKTTLNWLSEYALKFKDEKIFISFMHGDCTATNIISSGKKNILIDWEECIEDGIPIDIFYFNFRKQIDEGFQWEIKGIVDFLVVLHYIYFQCRYDNVQTIDFIILNNEFVSVNK